MAVPDPLDAVFQFSLTMASSAFLIGDLQSLIGYDFQNAGLAEMALTHGSRHGRQSDYQRLEFLGDRVLSLVIAEELYSKFPDDAEGQLAARLSLLVRAETCASVGLGLKLDPFVILGEKEKRSGVQKMNSVLGDVVEALAGAIYLDGGLVAARAFILKGWADVLEKAPEQLKDAKTFVQEWALGLAMVLPSYEVKSRVGPEHAPIFTIVLKLQGGIEAEGQGPSKQAAEMAAAQNFIAREGLR